MTTKLDPLQQTIVNTHTYEEMFRTVETLLNNGYEKSADRWLELIHYKLNKERLELRTLMETYKDTKDFRNFFRTHDLYLFVEDMFTAVVESKEPNQKHYNKKWVSQLIENSVMKYEKLKYLNNVNKLNETDLENLK